MFTSCQPSSRSCSQSSRLPVSVCQSAPHYNKGDMKDRNWKCWLVGLVTIGNMAWLVWYQLWIWFGWWYQLWIWFGCFGINYEYGSVGFVSIVNMVRLVWCQLWICSGWLVFYKPTSIKVQTVAKAHQIYSTCKQYLLHNEEQAHGMVLCPPET